MDIKDLSTPIPKKKIPAFFYVSLSFYIFIGIGAIAFYLLAAKRPTPVVAAIVTDTVENAQVLGVVDTEPVEATDDGDDDGEEEVDPYAGMKFYRFVTSNRVQRLHVRKEPGMSGLILSRVYPGTPGYVLLKGLNWSYLVTGEKGDIRGFSFNYYLDLEEITKEEFPEEYLEEAKQLWLEAGENGLPGMDKPGIIGSNGIGRLASWPYDDSVSANNIESSTTEQEQ